MFRANMVISLAATIANAVVSMTFAAFDAGAVSLAWGSLAGVGVTVVGNYIALGRQSMVWPTLRNWRILLHFGIFSSASGLLGSMAERTPDLVVGRLVSLEGAGLFSRGNGLITLFRTALTSAIHPVIGSSLAMIHRENQDVRQALLRIFSALSAVGWPALVMLGLLAHPIIVIIFGAKWVAAVSVAQILCVGTALALIGNVCQTYLVSTGAVQSNFLLQVISVPIFVAAVAYGALVSLDGAAWGAAVPGGLITLISLEILRRKTGLGWREIGWSVTPSLLITLLTSLPPLAVVLTLGVEGQNPWGPLLLAGSGGILAWVGSIYLVRHPMRQDLTAMFGWAARKLGLRPVQSPAP